MQPFQQQFVLALTNKKTPQRQLVEDRKAERLMMGFINPGQNLENGRRMLVAVDGGHDSNKSHLSFSPDPSSRLYQLCQFLQSVLKSVQWSKMEYFHILPLLPSISSEGTCIFHQLLSYHQTRSQNEPKSSQMCRKSLKNLTKNSYIQNLATSTHHCHAKVRWGPDSLGHVRL